MGARARNTVRNNSSSPRAMLAMPSRYTNILQLTRSSRYIALSYLYIMGHSWGTPSHHTNACKIEISYFPIYTFSCIVHHSEKYGCALSSLRMRGEEGKEKHDVFFQRFLRPPIKKLTYTRKNTVWFTGLHTHHG